MAIDFPNSPSTGDIHTVSGKQWQWDGEKWTAYGVSLSPGVLKVDSGNSRVGINQTSPTVALDVTGSARITGDLTVSGTTVTVDAATILAKDRIVFEGATADSYETTLIVVDPTADRTLTLPNSDGTLALTGGASTAVTVADTTDTTCFVGLFESATGDLGPKSDAGITYNAGTGMLTATGLTGPLTGNAATATEATNVTVVANNSTDETVYPTFVDGATSTQGIETDTGLTYNPSTGVLTSTGFTGAVIGNVTGNASGTALTVTQASQPSITTLANVTSVGTLTGLTVEGTVDMVDGTGAGRHEELQGPKIKDYAETVNAIGAIGGGTQDIDLKLGNVVTGTVDTSTTTFTFTGEPTSGIGISFTLILANGGSQTVNWPSEVKWAGGTAPTLTTSGTDVLTFTTVDAGGTSWYGFPAGLAMA